MSPIRPTRSCCWWVSSTPGGNSWYGWDEDHVAGDPGTPAPSTPGTLVIVVELELMEEEEETFSGPPAEEEKGRDERKTGRGNMRDNRLLEDDDMWGGQRDCTRAVGRSR